VRQVRSHRIAIRPSASPSWSRRRCHLLGRRGSPAAGASPAATSSGTRTCATRARELCEELGVEVELAEVVAVHSNFHDRAKQTVGVWFRGRIAGGVPRAGDDLDQLGYFPLTDPPKLAFPTDAEVIAALRAAGHRPP
jgi:8-oxo-dGTP pyrophosphatase MutT (NUDIX family)